MASDGMHVPAGDSGFARSLVRSGIGALALVLLSAGLFVALGAFGGGFDGVAAPVAPEIVEPEPEPVPEPTPVPPVEEEPVPEPEEPEVPADPTTDPDRIDPASIRIQLLDGYKIDEGAAADRVVARLSELGYSVSFRTTGRDYEASAVFWGAGGEAAARQVAAELGIADVRPNPGTLNDEVAVHIMVGADRAG